METQYLLIRQCCFRRWRRALVILIAVLLPAGLMAPLPVHADTNYTALSFHDVVDREEDLSYDAITTDQLVRLFDWLKGDGWTVISLDDIDAARDGRRPLPPKAVLLTFDDGFQSAYARVYPLLLAYRYPAVIALTGAWMTDTTDGMVAYGDQRVPRNRFLSWPEVREMAASGLVEVASHSFALHGEVLANPQGTRRAAAATWTYDAKTGQYESDAAYRARIMADLQASYRQIADHLGKPPRSLVWPYGRYTDPAVDAAKAVGFTHFLSLTSGRGEAADDVAIPRLYVANRPKLQDVAGELEPPPLVTRSSRVACLSLDRLAAQPDAAAQDAELGRMIDTVHALGANVVVLEAAARPSTGAPLGKLFFPTALQRRGADLLGRAAWQIRSRAGVDLYLHLSLPATRAALGDDKIAAIYADLLKYTSADGLAIEATPGMLALGADSAAAPSTLPADIFRRRAAIDPAGSDDTRLDDAGRAAVIAWRAATAMQPQLKLMLIAPPLAAPPLALPLHRWPAPIADLLLLPPAPTDAAYQALVGQLTAAGWLQPGQAGQVALSLPPAALTDNAGIARVTANTRMAQASGATALALCPDLRRLDQPGGNSLRDLSPAQLATLAATFSAATYPLRP
ncbi:MAG TPA: poly-beta-1,6-N-acetyl-D-glucosamine N-deacetylase PgaB [Terriglobales bacterium]|nr:poly-beta-1,6-N-acetyl-D-glucosamine N-deacetylase PgaB [Terriglobales bacterium]